MTIPVHPMVFPLEELEARYDDAAPGTPRL